MSSYNAPVRSLTRGIDPRRLIYENKFINDAKANAINLASSKLKNVFGKEFYINRNLVYNKEIIKFLMDNDSQFYNNYNEDNSHINAYMNLNVIDSRTFMLVCTKHYIPGKIINSMMLNDNNDASEVYVYIFGKNSRKLIKKLDLLLNDIVKSTFNNVIYSVNSVGYSTDITSITLSKRKMDSLIYSHNEVETIKDHIDRFESDKDFYEQKQINYKTGILLYGNPGTGKSSLVKAIATEYHRAIVSINVSNIRNIDFARLTMMINNEDYEKYIILFEDIDTLFLKREDDIKNDIKEDNDRFNEYEHKMPRQKERTTNDIINDLLQFLDSAQSPSDVIFIATTNYINTVTDALDGALVRDGRFDLKLKVDELKEKDLPKFLETFDIPTYKTDEVIEEYHKKYGESDTYNQSKVQSILLKTKGSFAILDEEEK